MSYWEKFKQVKQVIVGIFQGIIGIATEIGYALAIMLVAFFICILVTSF
ncbi:MAG: hypothetical protein PVI33_02850 [Candidatus Omnitrophota bacterium]|jgi:hypothetical protein